MDENKLRETNTLREMCLTQAMACVTIDRNVQYDEPESSFSNICALWNIYLSGKTGGNVELNPGDVAAMMTLLKVARLMKNHSNADNWIDIAGYAACGFEVTRP